MRSQALCSARAARPRSSVSVAERAWPLTTRCWRTCTVGALPAPRCDAQLAASRLLERCSAIRARRADGAWASSAAARGARSAATRVHRAGAGGDGPRPGRAGWSRIAALHVRPRAAVERFDATLIPASGCRATSRSALGLDADVLDGSADASADVVDDLVRFLGRLADRGPGRAAHLGVCRGRGAPPRQALVGAAAGRRQRAGDAAAWTSRQADAWRWWQPGLGIGTGRSRARTRKRACWPGRHASALLPMGKVLSACSGRRCSRCDAATTAHALPEQPGRVRACAMPTRRRCTSAKRGACARGWRRTCTGRWARRGASRAWSARSRAVEPPCARRTWRRWCSKIARSVACSRASTPSAGSARRGSGSDCRPPSGDPASKRAGAASSSNRAWATSRRRRRVRRTIPQRDAGRSRRGSWRARCSTWTRCGASDRAQYAVQLASAWHFLSGDTDSADDLRARSDPSRCCARCSRSIVRGRCCCPPIRARRATRSCGRRPRASRASVSTTAYLSAWAVRCGRRHAQPVRARDCSASAEPRTTPEDVDVVLRWFGAQRPPARLVHLPGRLAGRRRRDRRRRSASATGVGSVNGPSPGSARRAPSDAARARSSSARSSARSAPASVIAARLISTLSAALFERRLSQQRADQHVGDHRGVQHGAASSATSSTSAHDARGLAAARQPPSAARPGWPLTRAAFCASSRARQLVGRADLVERLRHRRRRARPAVGAARAARRSMRRACVLDVGQPRPADRQVGGHLRPARRRARRPGRPRRHRQGRIGRAQALEQLADASDRGSKPMSEWFNASLEMVSGADARVAVDALVECVPNFSEGTRPEVMDAIQAAAASVRGARGARSPRRRGPQPHGADHRRLARAGGRSRLSRHGSRRGADRPGHAPRRAPAHRRDRRGPVRAARRDRACRCASSSPCASDAASPPSSTCPSTCMARPPARPSGAACPTCGAASTSVCEPSWRIEPQPGAGFRAAARRPGRRNRRRRAPTADRLQHHPGDRRPGTRASASRAAFASRAAGCRRSRRAAFGRPTRTWSRCR